MASKSKSIFDLIKDATRSTVDKIYGNGASHSQSPFACKAIFQSLSMLTKCYVMRLIFIENSFDLETLSEWANANSQKEHRAAIEELLRLRIVVEVNNIKEEDSSSNSFQVIDVDNILKHMVNPHFLINFRSALTTPLHPWANDTTTETPLVISIPPTKQELEIYTTTRWNEVLGFIVDILPPNHQLLEFNILRTFVKRAKIMKETSPNSNTLIITSIGYEYMLKDYATQVWEFVLQSIMNSTSTEEALSLLFMLSFCIFGQGYLLSSLTKVQRQLVFEFSQLGLIYMRDPRTAVYFYPTKIAISMIFGKQAVGSHNLNNINITNGSGGSGGDVVGNKGKTAVLQVCTVCVCYVLCLGCEFVVFGRLYYMC